MWDRGLKYVLKKNMSSKKDLFLSHVGQTSSLPLMLDVAKAEGVYIFDTTGKRYIDMNSGISVSSMGHGHPEIIEAVISQSKNYMHTMVYGEHIQSPQVEFAQNLSELLPDQLNSLYYLMSGTEATELAMKLARKTSNRYQLIACRNAYHGSTIGAESLRSDLSYTSSFMPLVPGIRHINFNSLEDLGKITEETAGVICEVIQGEAGVISATNEFLTELRKKCDQTGALLIFDEIQSGFGRTGSLFAFEQYAVIPDILLIGKAMGGGMPLAGVVSSHEIMQNLIANPSLGHITTFGGHPVSCASANTMLKILLRENLIEKIVEKSKMLQSALSNHPIIKEVRAAGLMMAVEPTRRKYLKHIVARAFQLGVLVDWFLFNNRSFRLAPPLVINHDEIDEACKILLEACDYAQRQYH